MVCGRFREEFQLSKFGFGRIDRSVLYDSFVSLVFEFFNMTQKLPLFLVVINKNIPEIDSSVRFLYLYTTMVNTSL